MVYDRTAPPTLPSDLAGTTAATFAPPNSGNLVAAPMRSLLYLLARSRKVELGIIATQFGPMIEPKLLQQMKRDLADLERTLDEG